MQVRDPKKIKRLMLLKDPEVSARQLSAGVGWKSHTHLNRILAGTHKTVTDEKAQAIAEYLGCDVTDLFVPNVSTDGGHSDTSRKAS